MRLLTAELPGVGGALRERCEDFFVEEIPAYAPSGVGEHIFVDLEKTDLSTFEAVRRIARALGVADADIGTAGLKDRRAVTRQRISLPPPVTPEAALALALPGVTVLAAARHEHKLRTGHQRGNRFRLRVSRLDIPDDEAVRRATAILSRLARAPGLPNRFGAQRFGARGDNARRGRALLAGERLPGGPPSPRERRLLLSAWQAEIFNRWLDERLDDGLLDRVLEGDLLAKVATGGVFPTDDPAIDQPRLDAGELVPTGPMPGAEMRAPRAGTLCALREERLLAADGLSPECLARWSRLMPGTRRPAAIPLGDARAAVAEGGGLLLEFTLPSGAYATVVAEEVMKCAILPLGDEPD
ncbi:MAG: tRNA pseudouridine(13) synthase TruD [Myxococcales bacterium]|nr:tRNA pseudouridine(13) synthase TruD [Myxococcales bacterium]